MRAIYKKIQWIIFFQILVLTSVYGETFYTYQSGRWDSIDTWTLDPSGTLLVGTTTPGNNDSVIVLPSRTVTLTRDIPTTGLSIEINASGYIDMQQFRFTSNLSKLAGEGTIQLKSMDFPSATSNTFVQAGGGTVELQDTANFNFANQFVYNNLTLDFRNAAVVGTFINPTLVINGNMNIKKGILQINNATANTRSITIYGNLEVSSEGIIQLGSGNANHILTIKGNFTNYGSVDFYENNTADYSGTVYATTAHADVIFNDNTKDQDLLCYGNSEFYRIEINKGTDWTYSLNISADNTTRFKLYGQNAVDQPGDPPTTNPKALGLIAGTVRLGPNIVIPSLTTDAGCDYRNYNILPEAQMIIDGATVSTSNTAQDVAFVVYGKLVVNNGTLDARNTRVSIITRAASVLEIHGGTVWATQLRTSNEAGTHRGAFIMTGGILNLTTNSNQLCWGDNSRRHATLSFTYPDNIFQMSGGIINIQGSTAAGVQVTPGPDGTNGYNFSMVLGSSSANYNVTGGTIHITVPNGRPAYITSTVPIWNLNVERTAGTSVFSITDFTSANPAGVNAQPLVVLNNFKLLGTAVFDNTSNQNISVGDTFAINTGTTYMPGNNTTIFNGSGAQYFDVSGTINGNLQNLTLSNTADVTLANNNITLDGNLTIEDGCTLRDNGRIITVAGNVSNSGVHTGTGSIRLVTNAGTQSISGDGSGVFGNLYLNNTNAAAAPVSLSASIRVKGVLNLVSAKIFNISNYNLFLDTLASISGGFGANCFIATNGDIGDRGITKTINATNFTFPVGVIPTAVRYTPTTIAFNTVPNPYCSVTVYPVDGEQMQTSSNGKNRSLTYFWRVRATGFTVGSATVSQTFTYATSDVVTGAPQIDENSYVPARYNPATYSWSIGATTDINIGSNLISWPNNVTYIDGDYTAGDNTPQNPFGAVTVLYSYQSGDWRGNTTWTLDTTTVPIVGTSTDPDANTPVMIRNGNTVTCDQNNNACGSIQIQSNGVLDCNTRTGLNFGTVINHINGSGRIKIARTAATTAFPSGDFSAFLGESGGTIEYYNLAASDFTLPTATGSGDAITTYKNLVITPPTGRFISLPNTNLTIFGDFTAQGAGTGIVNFNTGVNARTVTINGNLNVNSGNLYINNTQAQSIIVNGNINVSGNFSSITNNGTHSLTVYGSITNNGTINFQTTAARVCNITFNGSTSTLLTGTGNTTLNNVTVNKGTTRETLLTINVTGTFTTPATNWLTLSNGTLRFMRTGNFNISTTNSFTIPNTAGLYINHPTATTYICNSNNDAYDLFLNGKLTLVDGTINIGPTAAPTANNDIEYSASGNSELEVEGGRLNVNGQIRRNTGSSGGMLAYTQSGGDVYIYGINQQATRAKLEITNTGSQFNMSGGTIYIVRGGGNGLYGDVYICPESSAVTGGTILFSQGTYDAVQSYLLNANVPLNNITITGKTAVTARNATVTLLVNPLALNGSLTLSNANSIFNANGINLSLKGNLANDGTFTSGSNTTTFDGEDQLISGTRYPTFNNLFISSSDSLTLQDSIYITGNLTLNGKLSSGIHKVYLSGNVTNNSVHSSSTTAGLVFNGTALQNIYGTGVFGRLVLDNPNGVRINNNITLEKNLKLTRGILNINQYLLTLGENSIIEDIDFSTSKMIMTDGVYSNVGLVKQFPSGSFQFTFPVGVSGKLTKVYINATSNSAAGSIRVNPINSYHPTASKPDSVLQFFWEIANNGLSNVSASIDCYYSQGDIKGNEARYVASALLASETTWSKASLGDDLTDMVEDANNIIHFTYSGVNSFSGEYTAGDVLAIPDSVKTYISKGSGNWNDINNWNPTPPSGGPNGFIVVIRPQDSIYTNGNRRFAYRTTINGVLYIGTSYGHNLGSVSGTGRLYLATATMPAGRYTSFFNCYGGTVEYGGSSNYTIIATNMDTVRRLYFSGTGARRLPNKTLYVCDSLRINGPTVDNSVNNRKLVVMGSIIRTSGVFTSGTGSEATVCMKGITSQTIGNFTGTSAINNLEIDNATGVTLSDAVQIKGNLMLTRGVITTNTSVEDSLSIINTAIDCVIPDGGSSSSYVNGPLIKSIIAGESFTFPVGKGASRNGKITVFNTLNGTSRWTAQYFNSGYSVADKNAPLTAISLSEYWQVIGTAGNQAKVKLRWDTQSDINPSVTQNGISDIRVSELNASDRWIELATTTSGATSLGYAETNSRVPLETHFFTLAAINTVRYIARFSSTTPVCFGSTISIVFTGPSPWEYNYTIDGTPVGIATASSNPENITASTAGRYYLTTYISNSVPQTVDTAGVTVRALISSPTTTGASRCGNGSVTLSAGGAGSNESYYWYNALIGGSLLQSGGTTYATPAIGDTTVYYVAKYNTVNLCQSTPRIPVTAIIVDQPVSPGLTKNPVADTVCAGVSLTAANTAGYGGCGVTNDVYRYTTNGGVVWNDWTPASSFAAVKGTNQISSWRTATGTGCVTSIPTVVSWFVTPQPAIVPLHRVPNK